MGIDESPEEHSSETEHKVTIEEVATFVMPKRAAKIRPIRRPKDQTPPDKS